MSKRLPDSRHDLSDGTRHRNAKRSRFILNVLLAGLLAGTASSNSLASDRRVATERFTEYAPVVHVQPIYQEVRTSEPRQECWSEEQRVIVGHESSVRGERYRPHHQQHHSTSGNAIVGGLIGGVIGNQLGRGHSSHSRAGATVAGAIIGGAIANEAGNQVTRHRRYETPRHVESRPIYETRTVERCRRVVDSRAQQRLQYYNVTYRYKGREFVTRMPRDPGKRIELQVSVAPARR
ncbi:glycine zipper 2TM domain-containing protein [Granulosicoccus sp. 3-233]|uniref:glycine zipper 2TM domain-containing protein n=1 Tax=Granulosicoccus sp. 3-233 TaxID=3417969 RepID=UPI003D3387A4